MDMMLSQQFCKLPDITRIMLKVVKEMQNRVAIKLQDIYYGKK